MNEADSKATEELFLPEPRPRLLLVGATVLVVATITMSFFIGRFFESLPAFLGFWSFYILGAWILILATMPRHLLWTLYRAPTIRPGFHRVLTWTPPIATFSLVFVEVMSRLGLHVLALVLVVALVNGSTEELLWRGLFGATFPNEVQKAYLIPSILFGACHIAPAIIPGMHFRGGPLLLLAGGIFLGLAWGWVHWRTRDLQSITLAHILVNFFAFSELAAMNGLAK